MSVKKLSLSLVLITKNEAHQLERCLRSVPFASDVVVLDSGSTDATVETAKALGARVFIEEWRGFGLQRRRAVELAAHDWVLCLDADEALSPELAAEIQARFAELDTKTAYRFPRLSFHLGRWIRHGGWHPDWQLRFFNRQHSTWSEAPVHEKVQAAQIGDFRSNLLHWVFRDLSHQVHTNDRYSTLQAQELHAKGVRSSLLKMLIKPKVKFWECYLFKLGFLDGRAGLVIAVGAAYSVFLKWSKLWEIQSIKKEV